MQDYYAILGVERRASADEIKRAYKDLAKKYHPDVCSHAGEAERKKNEERFKGISEAYAVLSDEKKRRHYDHVGSERFHSTYSAEDIFSGANFSEVFAEMNLGGAWGEVFSELFGGRGPHGRVRHRGQDVKYPLDVDFLDLFYGTKKKISFSPGAGGPQTEILLAIPQGLSHGAKLKVSGKGRPSKAGGPAGDLYVQVKMRPHPLWQRKGNDIYMQRALTLSEAVLGARITVESPDGKKQVSVPAGSGDGRKLRLKGLGFPHLASSGGKKDEAHRGDLYVVLSLAVPQSLTEQQKSLVEELQRSGL